MFLLREGVVIKHYIDDTLFLPIRMSVAGQ